LPWVVCISCVALSRRDFMSLYKLQTSSPFLRQKSEVSHISASTRQKGFFSTFSKLAFIFLYSLSVFSYPVRDSISVTQGFCPGLYVYHAVALSRRDFMSLYKLQTRSPFLRQKSEVTYFSLYEAFFLYFLIILTIYYIFQ